MELDRTHIVHFVEVMMADSFTKMFSVLALEVSPFLERVVKVNIPVVKSIYKINVDNTSTHSEFLEKLRFARSRNLVLKEIGNEQVGQIRPAS